MQPNTNTQFGDKEMLTDALASQKFVTSNYNSWVNECANPTLRDQMMSLLKEEHEIESDVFCEMQKRGWYQVTPADQNKVEQVKQKYLQQQ